MEQQKEVALEQAKQIVPNLSHKEERRLDDLFNQFCKTEPNKLRFHEFFMFCIDRSIVSSRISFPILYDLFLDCLDEDELNQTEKEKFLTKHQFNFLLVQLSRIMYSSPGETQNLDKLFNEYILAEKTVANKDSIESTRVPHFDEQTRRILTEPSIQALIQFQDDLQACFISYLSENYEAGEILLTWHEICLYHYLLNFSNKKIIVKTQIDKSWACKVFKRSPDYTQYSKYRKY